MNKVVETVVNLFKGTANAVAIAPKKNYASIVSGLTTMVDQLNELQLQESANIDVQNTVIANAQKQIDVSTKEINSAQKTADKLREILA